MNKYKLKIVTVNAIFVIVKHNFFQSDNVRYFANNRGPIDTPTKQFFLLGIGLITLFLYFL